MATNGYRTITVTDYDTLKFSWERTSYSIANNTSTISWKLQLISTGYGKIISSVSKDWSVTIAGDTVKGTNTVGISANSTKTLASGTKTIKHNSDGSKTFSYSFSQEFAINFGGSYIGTKSGSGEGTLNTIPRASVLSVSDGTLGAAQTLKITEYSSGFKHKLTYTCGSTSGYIIGSSSAASTTLSTSWTPPLSLANKNTSGTEVSITFKLTTYNNGSQVGDSKTYTKTFKMPSNVKPTVPTITVSDTTDYKNTYGNYVQNKSKIKVVGSASGSYGSTIESYTVTIDGNKVTHKEPFASSYSGTRTIKVVATDSRGRTNSETKTITVLPYSAPKFTSFTVTRDDTVDTTLKVSYSINYSSMDNENTLKIEVFNTGQTVSINNAEAKGTITIENVKTSTIENIYATVTDKLGGTGKSDYKTVLAPLRIISVYKTGKGVAIGKKAEDENYFDVAWPAMFRQSITGDVSTGSDRRIKKNIKNTDLNIIHKLQPVEYQLIDDETGRVHYGFIAQDIIKILIEAGINPVQSGLVGTVPNKDFEQLTLSYSEFIPLLVNDNQRLQQELTDMRNELKELKQLILKGRD